MDIVAEIRDLIRRHPGAPPPPIALFIDFVAESTRSWDSARLFVEMHPELLSERYLPPIFGFLMGMSESAERRADPRRAELSLELLERAQVLAQCGLVGIKEAFAAARSDIGVPRRQ
jgi:hypothetical protein